jgi:SAM-dependent methyltransferase
MPDDALDPLLDLEPRARFTDRAADYVRSRPDYPDAAWDEVLKGLGPPTALRIADVGAGTGISSRQLGDRGASVIAIEPNQAMREAAAAHPRVTWRDGTAECTGLEAGSVHVVVCAQAFHWFRQDQAVGEFHRVLRPAGRLALLWNCRDRDDPLTLGFIEAIHAVNGEHPVERIPFDPRVVETSGAFTPATLATIPHAQRLDREGLLGRALSASYVPRDGERWTELSRRLVALFDRHAGSEGRVTLRYRTEVWTAVRR